MKLETKIVLEDGEFISDLHRDFVTRKLEEISDYLEKVIKWNKGRSNETQKQKKKRKRS